MTVKLAKSSINIEPAYSPGFVVDINRNRSEYLAKLKECRHWFVKDGVVRSIVNRLSSFAKSGLYFHYEGKFSRVEQEAYSRIYRYASKVLQNAAVDYFVSGMAVIDYAFSYERFSRRRSIYIPKNIWLRPADEISLDRDPNTFDVRVFVQVSEEERYFFLNGGEYADGTKNTELYDFYVINYPAYVQAILRNEQKIAVPTAFCILSPSTSKSVYPVLYIEPAIPLLELRQKLIEMDYSIADRAANAIQHFKIGSDEFPLLDDGSEEEHPIIADLRKQLQTRPKTSVYRLFTNHTIDIKWSFPPLDSLLSKDKYAAIEDYIFYSLGFPASILRGESIRSNAGNIGYSFLSIFELLRPFKEGFKTFTSKLIDEVAELNNFANKPKVRFAVMPIYENRSIADLVKMAVENGFIDQTTFLEFIGVQTDGLKPENTSIEQEIAP